VRWLRDFLRSFAAGGRTVLVSSHVLAEVAQTVDNVLIINRGRLVVESTLAQLTARVGGAVRVRSPQLGALREALASEGIEATETEGVLFVRGVASERVGKVAAASAIVLSELVNEGSSLEEVFLELTADREIR
jgi:ABC-2 type transport system ATP-binding protein